MATLQVKGMDGQLYEALRRRAELDHRSISQEIITMIQDYLSHPSGHAGKATHEFLKLSGAWEGSESADDIITHLRKERKRSRRHPSIDDVFN